MYTKKTDTRTDPDGNKTIQYLLSISYDDALTAITAELGNPFRDTSSLFWNDSELTADDSWVILEYNEFHYTEGLTSKTNQVRLIKNNTTGKQWNWQRSE
jgi:hypothetical protein